MQESQTVSDTHRSFASSGESGPRHEVSSCCIGICSAEWLECRCDLPFCAGIRPQPPGIPVVCDRFGCLNQKTTASFVSLPRDVACAFCVSLPAMAGEAVSVPPFPQHVNLLTDQFSFLLWQLRGHPNPANEGHLKTGQRE